MENGRKIENRVYLDEKREHLREMNITGTFKSQLLQQQKLSHKPGLAKKFGDKWAGRIAERQEDQEMEEFF